MRFPCCALQIFGRYLRIIAQQAQEQLGDANSVAQEALGSMTTVRAFAAENEELARYREQLHKFYETNIKRCYAFTVYSVVATLLPNLATALVIFYGGKLVIEGIDCGYSFAHASPMCTLPHWALKLVCAYLGLS